MRIFVSEATKKYAHNLDDLRERWSISKEAPEDNNWMPVRLFSEQLVRKSRYELLKIKSELLEQHTQLNVEMRGYINRYKDTGRRLSREEFGEIVAAERSYTAHIHAVDTELGKRKKERKPERGPDIGPYFIDVAREELSSEQFHYILNLSAERRLANSDKQNKLDNL